MRTIKLLRLKTYPDNPGATNDYSYKAEDEESENLLSHITPTGEPFFRDFDRSGSNAGGVVLDKIRALVFSHGWGLAIKEDKQ